jgi:hypothetical protein
MADIPSSCIHRERCQEDRRARSIGERVAVMLRYPKCEIPKAARHRGDRAAQCDGLWCQGAESNC